MEKSTSKPATFYSLHSIFAALHQKFEFHSPPQILLQIYFKHWRFVQSAVKSIAKSTKYHVSCSSLIFVLFQTAQRKFTIHKTNFFVSHSSFSLVQIDLIDLTILNQIVQRSRKYYQVFLRVKIIQLHLDALDESECLTLTDSKQKTVIQLFLSSI